MNKVNFLSCISKRLKTIRVEAGLTQADIAKKGGLNRGQVIRIEKGVCDLRLFTLGRYLIAVNSTGSGLSLECLSLLNQCIDKDNEQKQT